MSINPKKLFLIDGLGALFSAFMLGFVLVWLEEYFGIPIHILYILSVFPILFFIYDMLVFRLVEKRIRLFLKVISVLNILYCILSLILFFGHYQELRLLGWIYIISEILIVLIIAGIEWKTASKI
jgi:hypothetical protein